MRLPWPDPDPIGPGQESVWDYPRPPRVEQSDRHVVVQLGDVVLADTRRAWRVMETSHAPSWYLPPDDIAMQHLRQAPGRSMCEWKGQADYLDVAVDEIVVPRVAWRYRNPVPAFAPIAALGCLGTAVGHLAVLAVTFGIFYGTLSLGRQRPAASLETPPVVSTVTES